MEKRKKKEKRRQNNTINFNSQEVYTEFEAEKYVMNNFIGEKEEKDK